MRIVLASQSPKKMTAVQKAFNHVSGVEIIAMQAQSGVNEQPIGMETHNGAKNRIDFVKAVRRESGRPDADLYISIENGIFVEEGKYVDRALVSISKQAGETFVVSSDGVEFPAQYVEETEKRGFKEWTVGKVMAEHGVVKDHADPHMDLVGKSRVDYIDQALREAVQKLGL